MHKKDPYLWFSSVNVEENGTVPMSFIHRDVVDEVKASWRPVTSFDAGKVGMTSIIAVSLSVLFSLRVGNITQVDVGSSRQCWTIIIRV
jgi:hypothetical protein